MPFPNIKAVFEHHGKDLKIDRNLAIEVRQYLSEFMNKNEQHVAFFSGVYVGVNKVVFAPADSNYFWNNILEMDRLEVQRDLMELRTKGGEPVINPSYKVISDPTNHAFLWLAHKVRNSQLKETEQIATITNLLMMLQIKFLTSLMNEYYPYPVDPRLAIATYNRLSRRFILRQYNSWREVLEYRANNIFNVAERAGNVKTNQVLDAFDNNDIILTMISGIQTAIRSSLVEYNIVFYKVRDEEKRILSTNQVGSIDGDEALMDKVSTINTYRTYMISIVGSEKDLIKDELLDVVTKNLGGVRFKPMYKVLRYISQNYGAKRQDHIKEFVDDSLVYSLNYLGRNNIPTKNLTVVFKRLHGNLSSGRSADPNLLRLRDIGDKIVNAALGSKDYKATVTSLRTAVMLYLTLRAVTLKHYSK